MSWRHDSQCSLRRRIAGAFGSLLLLIPSVAIAAGPITASQKQRNADNLVKEALHREIYGQAEERASLLKEAAGTVANFAPAMWHTGHVKIDGKWLTIDEVIAQTSEDRKLKKYEQQRGLAPATIDGQLALATWCARNDLPEQERAHLTRIIDVNPNHVEARTRLGFRMVDGVWISAEETKLAREQTAKAIKATTAWLPKLEPISEGLQSSSAKRRTTALNQLQAITQADAIPALELSLSGSSVTALPMIDCLSKMTSHEASLALARQATFSNLADVRAAAVKALKGRPYEGYVPAMLSVMYTPVQARTEIYQGPGRRLMYRQTFVREGQNQQDVLVLETAYRRIARAGGDSRDTFARVMFDMAGDAASRGTGVQQQNATAEAVNLQIINTLSQITGEVLPGTPEAWWAWWNAHNETVTEGPKQVVGRYQVEEVSITDRVQVSPGATSGGSTQAPSSYECLVAGTPIWTASGPKAIETIRVGDLVLSQNVDTGELAYKPVLKTTKRPKSLLVKIAAGDETIESSGGHPFWVSGEGWKKARLLQSGGQMHTVHGPISISQVERNREAETFNLVVADFHTYFVGKSRLLSHDHTIPQPTNSVVPGFTGQ